MKYLLIAIATFSCYKLFAQNTMRIHYKDGGIIELPTENVDSITFGDTDSLNVVEVELDGSWLWGSIENGYYELLTFSKDHTYTAYDNYFTYGFDTTTYGFYSQYSAMLTLWSNGFGYQHRYSWYITGLSSNTLSVMTKMGPFTYYRLQPEVVTVKVGDTISNGESILFCDGVVAQTENNLLIGRTQGETYILKMDNASQTIWAYKVIVK